MKSPSRTNRASARERWIGLRAGGHAASGLEIPTSPTDVETAAGPVRFALGPNNEPRILLPLPHGAKLPRLLTTPALHIGDAVYDQGKVALRFIDLVCLSTELESVFAEVADEMLERIRMGASCADACRSTLEDFRALLVPQSRVRTETVVGLVGELLLLDRLLEQNPTAWKLWRGPFGERHDFRGGDQAIEVKTTARAGNTRIAISAVDQLLPPSGGGLYVLHFALEHVEGGKLSVGGLVAAVRKKASQPDEIRSRLLAVECTNPDSHEWNRKRFRLEKESLYLVDHAFPKIVPHTFGATGVPSGVGSIKYEVDLSCAVASLLGAEETTTVVSRLLECLSQD